MNDFSAQYPPPAERYDDPIEVDLQKVFSPFDKVIRSARRDKRINAPAACWLYMQVWKYRHSKEVLNEIMTGIIGWGIEGNQLFETYIKEIREKPL